MTITDEERTDAWAALPTPVDELARGDSVPLGWEEVGQQTQALAREILRLKAERAGFPVNPRFDECECYVARWHRGEDDGAAAREIHDLLLALDGPDHLWAMGEVLRLIREQGLPGSDAGDFLGGESFEPFFAQHRWSGKSGGYELAQQLDDILGDVRREERRA